MMLPIAAGLIRLIPQGQGSRGHQHSPVDQVVVRSPTDHFAVCLMLGIAYSASIGGIITIIGTPPNVLLVGFLHDTIAPPLRVEISFVRWLAIGLPLAAVFLPIAWLLLTRVLFPVPFSPIDGGDALIRSQLRDLGPTGRAEWMTLIMFSVTAVCWILHPWLSQIQWTFSGRRLQPFHGLSDAGIAITGALTLFVLPVHIRSRQFVLDWQTAGQLPWGILLLFGGGLSLAAAVQANGVAEFLASHFRYAAEMPDWVVVLAVTAGVIFLTELTSNTATTAALLPVLAAFGPGLGVHPYKLIFPTAIAASCAFMLPVATPPNAIVFGTGHVTIGQMAKAGLWMNLVGIVLVTLLTTLIVCPLLGI